MPNQFNQWLTNTPFYQWLTNTSNTPQELSLLFMRMRKCVGIIGVSLPPVLIIGLIVLEGHSKILDSISVYYYSDYSDYRVIGNIFDGSMFATGIFLICYQYQLLDDIVSTIAGICAIGVALFPTTPPIRYPNELQMIYGNLHTFFAAIFLGSLAIFSLWLFRKSDKKDPQDRTPEKRLRNKVYFVCGIVILIILVVAGLDLFVPYLHDAPWLQPHHPLIWLEGLAVEVFGIAWFVKGETFGILKDKETPAPEGVKNRATRVVASTLGILAGLLGVLHGIFEIFQSNGDPHGIYIFALGPPCQANSEWHSCFPAMTIIPNFLVTGVVAIIVSFIIIIWAAAFVQWKYGGMILILLSMIQFLVGGGYISLILCFIAGVVGTRIQAPFTWWHTHLSVLRYWLAKGWPWSLFAFGILLAIYSILGSSFNEFVLSLSLLPPLFTGLLLLVLALAILAGFAYDIQNQTNTHQASSVTNKLPQLQDGG